MEQHEWNDRYAATELVWSAEPNRFVAEIVGPMPPGRAIDVACGEGRNAIWMAEDGWTVTGVDFSDVAIAKATRLAEARGVAVDWVCADVVTWQPPEASADLVLVCYLHLPHEQMRSVATHAAASLVPGGAVVVVAHALANLDGGYGGPSDPAVLYTPDDVVTWLDGLEVERAEHVHRVVTTPEGERTAVDLVVVARRR